MCIFLLHIARFRCIYSITSLTPCLSSSSRSVKKEGKKEKFFSDRLVNVYHADCVNINRVDSLSNLAGDGHRWLVVASSCCPSPPPAPLLDAGYDTEPLSPEDYRYRLAHITVSLRKLREWVTRSRSRRRYSRDDPFGETGIAPRLAHDVVAH